MLRATGQVVAAEALHRQHPAGGHHLHRSAQGRVSRRGAEAHRRPAVGTRIRLGVEAAVGGVVVLGLAARAHPKAGHGGERAVVRHAAHDREARAAVRAVHERVAVAAVRGVEELAQAVLAGGGVGRHAGVGLAPAPALADHEPALARGLERRGEHALHPGQRRRLGGQPLLEAPQRRRLALHLDQHSALVVQHEAGQPQLAGEPVHVGPEPHALHHPLHAGAHAPRGAHAPVRSSSSRSTCQALACASWMRGMCSERVTTTWSASLSAATRPPS